MLTEITSTQYLSIITFEMLPPILLLAMYKLSKEIL
mgnify:CR=1 FL=1